MVFAERQRFKQWWLWLILLGIGAVLIFRLYTQIDLIEQSNDLPESEKAFFFSLGLLASIALLFAFARLDTRIQRDGVYVRFLPFHFSFRHYPWEKISKAYVRKYNPIAEYGGWGLRLGLFGKGKAFNVSGNIGLQLEFSNGKKLLIGTKKPEDLKRILEKVPKTDKM